MRAIALCCLILGCLILALAGPVPPARAQSPLEGPLVSPTPAAKPATPHAKAKPRHASARKAPSDADRLPDGRPGATPTAVAASKSGDPASPLSLGMKWNGNNDNAVQTRTQNYGGDAQGAGAEVGLKLHF